MKHTHSQRHGRLRAVLKEARLERGLTQQELCKRLGRDKNFVSYVETGTRMLDVLEFIEYARVLKLDPVETLARIL